MATAVVHVKILGCDLQQCLCALAQAKDTRTRIQTETRSWEHRLRLGLETQARIEPPLPRCARTRPERELWWYGGEGREVAEGKRLEREAETLWASGHRSCIHNHTVVSLIDKGREQPSEEGRREGKAGTTEGARGDGGRRIEGKIPSSLVTEQEGKNM